VPEPLRPAFLGCGFITEVHSRHLRAPGSNVVASYASRDAAKAETFRTRFGGIASYGSCTAAIDDPRIEATIVAVPPHPTSSSPCGPWRPANTCWSRSLRSHEPMITSPHAMPATEPPVSCWSATTLAQLHRGRGETERAIQRYRATLDKIPDHSEAKRGLAARPHLP